MGLLVRQALGEDVPALAAVAAETFGLACPPSMSTERVEAFIAEERAASHTLGGRSVFGWEAAAALAPAGVQARLDALLSSPRGLILAWVETSGLVVIIYLMVFKPF